MTVRGDVSVNWAVSPRIIEVAAPSTKITVQDLVDTLRTLESELDDLDNDFLIYATGKDVCGDITVGITLIFNNAKITFEDRPLGEWVICVVEGGNLGAIDSVGNPMDPREPAAYVNIDVSQSTSPTLVYASGGDPEVIASAVWDKPKSGHVGSGSFGEEVQSHATPSEVGSEVDQSLVAYDPPTKAELDAAETGIRGADNDDLKGISDQIDTVEGITDEVLDLLENRLIIDPATSEWVLYDDAGINVIKKWPLKDKDGKHVVLESGIVSERGKRTL